MNLTDSLKLLRDYADRGDEAAFRQLVEQYLDLVYSAALRRVGGDSGLAQDVTQTVFTDLARKAKSLRNKEMLGGWLYRYTGFVAANAVRGEKRRQIREQEAAQMNAISESSEALWLQLAPVLDDTIETLEPPDRQAVLLRFFERRDFRAIGAAMGISDDAAQKRVSRALEKLRALLTERGVTLTAVILSGFLASKVVQAAPAELVSAKVARIALAGAATSAGLGVTLLNLARSAAFKLMLGGAVVAVALWLVLQHHSSRALDPARSSGPVPALAAATNAFDTNQAPAKAVASAPRSNDTNTNGNVLLLNVVAADSGQPVPDVELEYLPSVNGKRKPQTTLVTTRFGICKVPVPDGTTELMLVSGRDGFADTLLDWQPEHGEQIPTQYTLKLARAVPISGQVVDPDGNPVAGAGIGFNNQPDPSAQTRPQSDDYYWPFWETAKTDAQGHWQINRIGQEAIRTLYGGATHPDFTGSGFVFLSQDTAARAQLLAGTMVFKLGHAVTVQGIVKDLTGNPVPDASVLVGHVSEGGSRKGKSGSDGTFTIKGCKPGQSLITAQAKGFAVTTLDVELADDSKPVEIVLHAGKLLKLRVVDSDGNPVPHARVWLNTVPHGGINFGQNKQAPAQADFNRHTDSKGRLKWDNAPDGDLTFDISADGYMRPDDMKIPADGTEHVVTLQPALTISGIVTDAATGQPIPHFRIITGWPEVNPVAHTTNDVWSPIDRFWLSFGAGTFHYTFDEPVISGVKDFAYVFKIEADGYAPFITRAVQPTERNAQFNVSLTAATTTEVTVLSPDGTPAAGTDVGLVTPGMFLMLVPGGISRENPQSGGSLLLSDGQGHFTLPPDSTITKVIAAGPQGYADVTTTELATNPFVQLQPWGRLEGTYLTNGQPVVGSTLSIEIHRGEAHDTICAPFSFQSKTDSDGHFSFPRVPPGNFDMMLVGFNDGSPWSGLRLPQEATIMPGGTTTVTMDITNQMVTGFPDPGVNDSN